MTISVIGNIGNGAELRTVNVNGVETSVCSFWMAENFKKRDGSTKTTWHKVTVWRKYAEVMAQYLTKGRKILVTAENAEAKTYTDKENRIRPYIDIQASKIELLDGKKPEETEPEVEVEDESTPWD